MYITSAHQTFAGRKPAVTPGFTFIELIVVIVILGIPAAVVGFFALAIFMPMWDLTKMVR